jgi:hypothetical protein
VLDHSACVYLSGSFEPAYILTLTAIPSLFAGPTVNKRNAFLIQHFFAEELHVEPDRGVVRFNAIPEDCYATDGITVQGKLEADLRKESVSNQSALHSVDAKGYQTADLKKERKRSQSMKETFGKKKKDKNAEGENVPSMPGAFPKMPDFELVSPMDKEAEKRQKVGKRKSFLGIFGRS